MMMSDSGERRGNTRHRRTPHEHPNFQQKVLRLGRGLL